MRGDKHDYDTWEAMGNPGWNYNDVLQYFKKSEDMRNPHLANSPYHGVGGYLTVGESFRSELSDSFLEAGRELGYAETDLNGEHGIGIMAPQATLRDGRRCSTAKAFLRSARTRSNLHLSLDSYVNRIIVDAETKTAIGVEYERDGDVHQVYASKEVILAAGTISSPQILMLSGIGPKEELNKHQISVIADLPVGENLQEHVGLAGLHFTADISATLSDIELSSIFDYTANGNGTLTSIITEAIAMIQTKYAKENVPDIQLTFIPDSPGWVLSDEYVRSSVVQRIPIWSIYPYLLRPKSKGSIKLRNSDPREHPVIYPNYFHSKHDMNVLIEGVKLAKRFGTTDTMLKLNSVYQQGAYTECNQFNATTDEHYECMIRQNTLNGNHNAGTCKMGPKKDKTSVVDHRLRVHRVHRLRVIDASIMPFLIGGNTMAPVIMIGEKGADMIAEHWRQAMNDVYF